MIKLTHRQWENILERIKEEYPVSVWANCQRITYNL
jgi:hypothetical protein